MMQEEMKDGIRRFFDEALEKVGAFRKKTYEEAFHNLYHTYEELLGSLLLYSDEPADESGWNDIVSVIPDYAQEKLNEISKREQKKTAMDMNLIMAVYVIPMITYTRSQTGDRLAEAIINLWNERNVTGLTLSKSSYDKIAQGFHKGLCYITTAVCIDQNKPDDCPELTELRRYRDDYLMQSEDGRALVEAYYDVAPAIVCAIDMQKDASDIYQNLYHDYLVPCVTLAKNRKNEACRMLYQNMVQQLEREYL